MKETSIKQTISKKLFEEARLHIPGGVDSPVRAFKAVGGTPPFITKGKGARLFDEDGNEFIDYVGSWGAMVLGHAHPRMTRALKTAAARGTSYGAPTALEIELARRIKQAVPSIELVRFVNSGTEATMSALRVARAFTGRDKIIKFEGCYHGHADGLLARAGSGAMTLSLPDSPGVPASFTEQTLIARYNDPDSVRSLFQNLGGEIAAVIIEPLAANMGVVKPQTGFLNGLRDITREYGSLLIFDEVITGFRLAFGGAQGLFGIKPDITCLGKIIGGGLPVGAYGGRKEIMELVAPLGPVYQAGTLSGNPLAMTAGIEALRILSRPGTYEKLENLGNALERGLQEAVKSNGQKVTISRMGSLLTMFFSREPVTDYDTAKLSNVELYKVFFHQMLKRGIYLPPSQFEALFISLSHRQSDIRQTVKAAGESFRAMRPGK